MIINSHLLDTDWEMQRTSLLLCPRPPDNEPGKQPGLIYLFIPVERGGSENEEGVSC